MGKRSWIRYTINLLKSNSICTYSWHISTATTGFKLLDASKNCGDKFLLLSSVNSSQLLLVVAVYFLIFFHFMCTVTVNVYIYLDRRTLLICVDSNRSCYKTNQLVYCKQRLHLLHNSPFNFVFFFIHLFLFCFRFYQSVTLVVCLPVLI